MQTHQLDLNNNDSFIHARTQMNIKKAHRIEGKKQKSLFILIKFVLLCKFEKKMSESENKIYKACGYLPRIMRIFMA